MSATSGAVIEREVPARVDRWGPHVPGTGPSDAYGDYDEQMAPPERLTRLRTETWGIGYVRRRNPPLTPEEIDDIAGWPEGTCAQIEVGALVVSVLHVRRLGSLLFRRDQTQRGYWMEMDGHFGAGNGTAVAAAVEALCRRHGLTPEELGGKAGISPARMRSFVRGGQWTVDGATLRRLARAAGEHLPE